MEEEGMRGGRREELGGGGKGLDWRDQERGNWEAGGGSEVRMRKGEGASASFRGKRGRGSGWEIWIWKTNSSRSHTHGMASWMDWSGLLRCDGRWRFGGQEREAFTGELT